MNFLKNALDISHRDDTGVIAAYGSKQSALYTGSKQHSSFRNALASVNCM